MKFEELLKKCEAQPFKINLTKGEIKIGKTVYTKDELDLSDVSTEEMVKQMEDYFIKFKYSVPSAVSAKMNSYFTALPDKELSAEDYLIGEPRHVAQAKLELYVLALKLQGKLVSLFKGDAWFWQSQTDPDLVVLKKWIA